MPDPDLTPLTPEECERIKKDYFATLCEIGERRLRDTIDRLQEDIQAYRSSREVLKSDLTQCAKEIDRLTAQVEAQGREIERLRKAAKLAIKNFERQNFDPNTSHLGDDDFEVWTALEKALTTTERVDG